MAVVKNKKEYGNVYEILLSNSKYVYVCWIERCSFGIFNYVSEKPTNLENLLSVGFKAYKEGKETAVKKKIWKLTGHIDLEKENIQLPDLVIFQSWRKEYSIKQAIVMRNGSPLEASTEDYLTLLKKGYIYGFFDNYKSFEEWLAKYIENYPENQDIFPLPERYN
jgi:hypothetical protein